MKLGDLGIGSLGLWLHLRGRSHDGADPAPDLPLSDERTVLAHVSDGAETAAQQVWRRLGPVRPRIRLLRCGEGGVPDPRDDLAQAQALIATARPRCLLLFGPDLPPALITAAHRASVPIILAEARLDNPDLGWTMAAAIRRRLIAQIDHILVTDPSSYRVAVGMGADPERVVLTGPVAEIREPLDCNETERSTLAQLLRGRHAWLAAAVPESEENAVMDAHLAALLNSHRALLFLAPCDPGRIDALASMIEARGLSVARRSLDEDPADDVQVMITDGVTEMGLWYRLAPVTYMGGTLSGDDALTRHPFEPAALGSAIVHGTATQRYQTEWQQLDGAGASRQVSSPEDLAAAVAELSQADLIATMAHNAWTVSTGGAEVTMHICAPVLAALNREAA